MSVSPSWLPATSYVRGPVQTPLARDCETSKGKGRWPQAETDGRWRHLLAPGGPAFSL